MSVVSPPGAGPLSADRQALVERMQEIDVHAGVVDDPAMTVEKLREMMRALGVRPEDNGASQELLRMRYGDDGVEE